MCEKKSSSENYRVAGRGQLPRGMVDWRVEPTAHQSKKPPLKRETTTKEKPPSEIETTTKVETTTKAGIEQSKGGGEVGRGAQDFPGPIYIQVGWRLPSLHQTSWLPPHLTPPMLIPPPACPAANQPATRPGRRCGPDGPSTRSSPSPATSAAPTGGASGRPWPTRTGLCCPTSSSATPN